MLTNRSCFGFNKSRHIFWERAMANEPSCAYDVMTVRYWRLFLSKLWDFFLVYCRYPTNKKKKLPRLNARKQSSNYVLHLGIKEPHQILLYGLDPIHQIAIQWPWYVLADRIVTLGVILRFGSLTVRWIIPSQPLKYIMLKEHKFLYNSANFAHINKFCLTGILKKK